MLNQVVLVGRLVQDLEVKKDENGKSVVNLTLAVPRPYKNSNGEYETDFISCLLYNAMADNTTEYCKKGDLLGIKGRLQTRKYEENDVFKYVQEVVAEKVSFLSSNKVGVEDE